jgi:hypothetical protein
MQTTNPKVFGGDTVRGADLVVRAAFDFRTRGEVDPACSRQPRLRSRRSVSETRFAPGFKGIISS